MTNEKIVKFVNRNCRLTNCFLCPMDEIYHSYKNCPYLRLKQIARERKIIIDDVKANYKEEK